jgi:transketolase
MSQAMKDAFSNTILEVGEHDERLVVLVGDISHFALQPFAKACPGRYYNVGILEPTIVSMAAGLASVGFLPVAHTIAPFLIERSFEQIKLDFCYQNIGGTLISVGSAFDYSTLGCTHHCYDDMGLISALPGTEVVYPASPQELNLLFKQTYANGRLTYIRMARHAHSVKFADDQVKFGKGIVVKSGRDLSIIVTGPQLETAMQSLPLLRDSGIDAEVIYVSTIKPLDEDCVRASAAKTKRVLVIEEHVRQAGLGDAVLRVIYGVAGIKFDSIHIPNTFLRNYGTYEQHCASLNFTPQGINECVRNMLGRQGGGVRAI